MERQVAQGLYKRKFLHAPVTLTCWVVAMINLKSCITLLCLVAFLGGAMPARAWGPIGHRVSARIAEQNIDGATRARIELILGAETLREAANVPDEQRSNPAAFWQEQAGPWHYVTLPAGARAGDLAHPPEGDAATALAEFTGILRDPGAEQAEKARALRFVVHIVADLHQPLHVGNGSDRGGNDLFVLWDGVPRTLHHVWDESLIGHKQLSAAEYTERLTGRMTPADVIGWWETDPAAWMQESADLRERIYPASGGELGEGTADDPLRLSHWHYVYDWTPAMEQRLAQSGIRLAAYLDWVFAGAQ